MEWWARRIDIAPSQKTSSYVLKIARQENLPRATKIRNSLSFN